MGNILSSSVVVVGLGYIGLPTAAILAANGLDVVGKDINPATVAAVSRGEVPFVEPDLGGYVAKAVLSGALRASTTTPRADVYIVAVPTPFKEDRTPDLSYIEAAADDIAELLQGDELVILESTSPPGATQHMADRILKARPDLAGPVDDPYSVIHFAHCPERVLPGRVMIELVTNDRIIGGLTSEASRRAKSLYETFCQGEIVLTEARTAEMAKLVENSFRDVNIAFANELSVICARLGIDVWELIKLANHHPRVNVLQPGPGVGGHCIAVDPWFIIASAPEDAKLIRQARVVNDSKPQWVVEQVVEALRRDSALQKVGVLGLAFKANIDDLRESPAVDIVEALSVSLPNTEVLVAEPHVDALPPRLQDLDNVVLESTETVVDKSDLILLLVDHTVFKSIDADQLTNKYIVDTKGVWRQPVVTVS